MIKLLIPLLLLVACGKAKEMPEDDLREEINEDGVYFGEIWSLDKNVSKGSIRISKMNDAVDVTLKLNSPANGHYLYEGSLCPGLASEIETTSGRRLMAFEPGTYSSSYSLMLADLGLDAMRFEDKTLIIYQNGVATGCANIERHFDEGPTIPEERPPRHRQPRIPGPPPRPRQPTPHPPPPPPDDGPSWWERLGDRLRDWWCRVRGRCG